jgi:heptaprenyl diphosphate synthase
MLTPPPGNVCPEGTAPGENRDFRNRRSLALLGSFCLFLSTLEYLIPKPLPFMRIGLANLPLILALDLFPPGVFALLAAVKITGQALITGTLFSYVFLFSLAGSSVSALVMYGLRRLLGKNRVSFTGLGIAGAVLSNLVQLVLARFFIFGESVRFLVPLFLASGLISGGALGFFGEAFAARSRWYRRALGETAEAGDPSAGSGETGAAPAITAPAEGAGAAARAGAPERAEGEQVPAAPPDRETRRLERQARWNRFFRSGDLFIAGLFMMLAFLFTPSLVFKALQCLLFWLLLWGAGKKNRPLTTGLVILGIVFCNLLVPYGKVLAEFGPLNISEGALLAGLRRALTLEGLILLSRTFIRPDIRFPGAFGSILGESFRIFGALQERKTIISRKHIIEGIDRLMLELDRDAGAGSGPTPVAAPRRHPASLALLALMALFCVLLALVDTPAR